MVEAHWMELKDFIFPRKSFMAGRGGDEEGVFSMDMCWWALSK